MHMATLTGSIRADVPIGFADEEWTEYVWRSMYGSYEKGSADVAASLPEIDAESGTVTFRKESDTAVRVTVEVEYRPHDHGRRAEEIAQAQTRLERDLNKFRTFLLRRCEQESCRAA